MAISQYISALHDKNIIHRDLKLGNLFLGPNLEIKCGDFGLATKLDHPEERKRTICGTPNYIAPEILDNKNGHSFEVDVWSIGVIMYTLLIGKPPFETTSVKTTYKRIRSNVYSFPTNVHISTAARSLIKSILHSKPEKRPTLHDMKQHDFFTRTTFPLQLPLSCLTRPLVYRVENRKENVNHKLSSTKSHNKRNRAPLGDCTNANNKNMINQAKNNRKLTAIKPLSSDKVIGIAKNTRNALLDFHDKWQQEKINHQKTNSNDDTNNNNNKLWQLPSSLSSDHKNNDQQQKWKYDHRKEEGLQVVGVDDDDQINFRKVHDEIEQSFSIAKKKN